MHKHISTNPMNTPSRDIFPNLEACKTHTKYRSRDGSAMAIADLKRIDVRFPLLEKLYDTQCAASKDKSLKKQLTRLFNTMDSILDQIKPRTLSTEYITLQLCLESWPHMADSPPQDVVDSVFKKLNREASTPRSQEELRGFLDTAKGNPWDPMG